MKMKTRSAAKKRVRKTGSGKYKTMKAARGHLLQQKGSAQKRTGKKGKVVLASKAFRKHLEKALPGM
jgi:large subunit ribosomal protein L35